MSILARDSITVAWQKDIASVTWYYKLQSSTANPPAKPTTETPSGWSTTEPTYTEGSTNSLYVCQKTTYSDSTFEYSDVSLSSSYEAAKIAYNKSVTALEAATPIETRTYSDIIGTANTAANASFYFAKIHPTNYTVNWKVRFKIAVKAPETHSQTVDIQFGGYGSTLSSYDSYVTRNESLGMYYVNLYRAKQAGITNHKGHAVGFGLRSSANPIDASYKRTFYVELLEVENCTVDFMDTAMKYANIDGTGSTNYSSLSEMVVATAGQNATNNKDTNTSYTQFSSGVTTGANNIFPYSLILKDSEKTWVSLTTTGGAGTSKTVYNGGLFYDRVLYMSANSTYETGATSGAVFDVYAADLQYSTNCAKTLTAREPVYLVGTINSDGLFYLDTTQWWTQTEPTTEDGKTYIYLGETYSTYQVYLSTENPAYQFYDGQFMRLEDIETLKAAKTATNYITDVTNDGVWVTPSDAKPVNGQAANTTSGWHISDAIELFRNGVSYLKAWIDNTKAKIRIGLESAGHTIFNENGMDVYNGSSKVASFGREVQIGKDDDSHLLLDYHSLKLIDSNGQTYFHISDFRTWHTASETYGEGFYYVNTDIFVVKDGWRQRYDLSCFAMTTDYSVTVNSTEVPSSDVTKLETGVIFSTPPSTGDRIVITYPSEVSSLKAYTAGTRDSSGSVGPMSFAEGTQTIASGWNSHVEGLLTEASGSNSHSEGAYTEAREEDSHAEGVHSVAKGYASHAEGDSTEASANASHAEGLNTKASGLHSHAGGEGTVAGYSNQTAIGIFNDNKYNNLFEVGNGTSDSARSNAFEVDSSGNVRQSGNIYCC